MLDSIHARAGLVFQRLTEPSTWDDATVDACQKMALQEIALCGASLLLASRFRKSDREFTRIELPNFLYLIPVLLTGIIEKTAVDAPGRQLFSSYLRASLSNQYTTIFPFLLHELGHILMHTLLFKGPRRIRYLTNTGGGACECSRFNDATIFGDKVGRTKRDLLVSLGGPLADITTVVAGCAAVQFCHNIDLQILRKLKLEMFSVASNGADYAYSASQPVVDRGNDYVNIVSHTGVSPKCIAALWGCLAMIIMSMILYEMSMECFELFSESPNV